MPKQFVKMAQSNGDSCFLTERSDFEIHAITGHEVGHHYLWDRFSGINDEDAEYYSDVVAGWLYRRLGAILVLNELQRLLTTLGLIPCNQYESGGDRIRAFLQGWHDDQSEIPSLIRRLS